LSAFCIVDGRFDLAPVADDARVLEETFDIFLFKTGDAVEIKIVKRGAEVFSLCQDGALAQSGLEPFQAQFLKQALIIVNRVTPFVVMVFHQDRGLYHSY
jgi:hypothetical protein